MELGDKRYEERLEPVSGRALPVLKGETLRITQVEGEQCVDFNAFNLHDYKEYMSVGASRRQGLHLNRGDVLISNAPRYNAMLLINELPETCVTDTLGARCNAVLYEFRFGMEWHTNCQDTLAESIREYGLTPDDVHDSFNMFMNTTWDAKGAWWTEWNTGRAGDYVDLLACMDTLCVPIVCGSGDVALVSNFSLRPLDIAVFEATPDSLARVAEVEEQFAAPLSRKGPADYRQPNIRVERELTRDTTYERAFGRYPLQREQLSVSVDGATAEGLAAMVAAGYGNDLSDAARRAFMLWCQSNIGSVRRGDQSSSQSSRW
jgi:uncharacterized protein YcgI (DUF1989 family)